MARKKVDVELRLTDGPRRFRVQQLRVRDGHAVLERLIRVLGPAVGQVVDHLGETDPSKAVAGDLSRDGVAAAFDTLAAALRAEEGLIDWLVERLRPHIELETEESDVFVPMTLDIWDDVFAGEYLAESKLIAKALEVNYASFFGEGGLGAFAHKLVTPTRSPSASRRASRRGSGGSSATRVSRTG